jgi:hypothetical protein
LASDNAPGNFSEEERTDPGIRPSIEKFLDKNAYIGVLRLKRDIGKETARRMAADNPMLQSGRNQAHNFPSRVRAGFHGVAPDEEVGR